MFLYEETHQRDPPLHREKFEDRRCMIQGELYELFAPAI